MNTEKRLTLLNGLEPDQLWTVLGNPGTKPDKVSRQTLTKAALAQWDDELFLRVLDYLVEGTTIECRRERSLPIPNICQPTT